MIKNVVLIFDVSKNKDRGLCNFFSYPEVDFYEIRLKL